VSKTTVRNSLAGISGKSTPTGRNKWRLPIAECRFSIADLLFSHEKAQEAQNHFRLQICDTDTAGNVLVFRDNRKDNTDRSRSYAPLT
jgi:hypothetical protein